MRPCSRRAARAAGPTHSIAACWVATEAGERLRPRRRVHAPSAPPRRQTAPRQTAPPQAAPAPPHLRAPKRVVPPNRWRHLSRLSWRRMRPSPDCSASRPPYHHPTPSRPLLTKPTAHHPRPHSRPPPPRPPSLAPWRRRGPTLRRRRMAAWTASLPPRRSRQRHRACAAPMAARGLTPAWRRARCGCSTL